MDANKIANTDSLEQLKPLEVAEVKDEEAEKYERYISKHINNKFKIKELTDPEALERSEINND